MEENRRHVLGDPSRRCVHGKSRSVGFVDRTWCQMLDDWSRCCVYGKNIHWGRRHMLDDSSRRSVGHCWHDIIHDLWNGKQQV